MVNYNTLTMTTLHYAKPAVWVSAWAVLPPYRARN